MYDDHCIFWCAFVLSAWKWRRYKVESLGFNVFEQTLDIFLKFYPKFLRLSFFFFLRLFLKVLLSNHSDSNDWKSLSPLTRYRMTDYLRTLNPHNNSKTPSKHWLSIFFLNFNFCFLWKLKRFSRSIAILCSYPCVLLLHRFREKFNSKMRKNVNGFTWPV